MKTIIFTFIIFAFIFSSVFSCKSQTPKNDSYVSFRIDAPEKMSPLASKFRVGDYKFTLDNVYILNGIYTGLYIYSKQKDSENSILSLTFELPSGNKFKAFSDSGFVIQSPPLPCTITDEDFQGIKSSSDGKVFAYISLERNKIYNENKVMYDSRVTFNIFKINISELSVDGNNLNLICTFSGEMNDKEKSSQDTDYQISGNISMKDVKIFTASVESEYR